MAELIPPGRKGKLKGDHNTTEGKENSGKGSSMQCQDSKKFEIILKALSITCRLCRDTSIWIGC